MVHEYNPGACMDCKSTGNLLDQLVFVGNGSSALLDGLLGAVQNRVGGVGWVGDKDGFLDVDGHDASDQERQSRDDECEKSHGCGLFSRMNKSDGLAVLLY